MASTTPLPASRLRMPLGRGRYSSLTRTSWSPRPTHTRAPTTRPPAALAPAPPHPLRQRHWLTWHACPRRRRNGFKRLQPTPLAHCWQLHATAPRTAFFSMRALPLPRGRRCRCLPRTWRSPPGQTAARAGGRLRALWATQRARAVAFCRHLAPGTNGGVPTEVLACCALPFRSKSQARTCLLERLPSPLLVALRGPALQWRAPWLAARRASQQPQLPVMRCRPATLALLRWGWRLRASAAQRTRTTPMPQCPRLSRRHKARRASQGDCAASRGLEM